MNVLVVDDQFVVVQGVIDGVNWEGLEVRQVFSANSVEEACAILRDKEIHILLCDIELPPRNGFEILEWIQKNHLHVQCIFLSAHAEFEYAQTAIKMNSFDYILQPARYEDIEEVVARAIIKIKENRQMRDDLQYGQYWKQNEEMLLTSCLIRFFHNDEGDIKSLLETLNTLNIALTRQSVITPVLVQILNESTLELGRSEMCHLLHQRIETLFQRDANTFLVADLQEDGIFIALYDGDLEWPDITQLLRELQAQLHASQMMEVAFYAGEFLSVERLYQEYQLLKRRCQDNVAGYSGVFTPSQKRPLHQYKYEFPDIQRWSTQLLGGECEMVRRDALRFLAEQRESRGLDAAFLAQFHQDFIQMFFTVAKAYEEDVHGIFYDQYPFEDFLDAYTSYEKMIALIHFAVDYLQTRMEKPKEEVSPVQQAVQYIRDNLESNLSCAEIAEAVFLNPNYLSRLFKREKGMSLNEYIISEKVQSACELLRGTSIPVSLVASKVGYSNFSYFSQVFKKQTNMSPGEYRQAKK